MHGTNFHHLLLIHKVAWRQKLLLSKAAGAKGVKMLHVTTLQAQFLIAYKKTLPKCMGGYALFGVAKSSLGWP